MEGKRKSDVSVTWNFIVGGCLRASYEVWKKAKIVYEEFDEVENENSLTTSW